MAESFIPVWMSIGEAEEFRRFLQEEARSDDGEFPEREFSLIDGALETERPRSFDQMRAEQGEPDAPTHQDGTRSIMDFVHRGGGSRVLVCGGRHYEDHDAVRRALADLGPKDLLIHGGATGADAHTNQIATEQGCHVARVDALWRVFGNRAGPLRNAAMLKLRPDKVIAFPGGRGTANCIAQAEAAGIPVEHASEALKGEG